jgi:hypothetical protein
MDTFLMFWNFPVELLKFFVSIGFWGAMVYIVYQFLVEYIFWR